MSGVAPAAQHDQPEFVEGLTHLAARRWDAAVVSLRIAAQREPGRLAVVRALATAYLRCGDAAEARDVLATFTRDFPMCADGWRLSAQLAWKLRRHDDAIAILARGLDHLPNSPVLHRQTALFLGARGRIEASANHADRARDTGRLGSWIDAVAGRPGDPTALLAQPPASAPCDPDWLDRVATDARLLDSLLKAPRDPHDAGMLTSLAARLAALLESQPYHADRQLLLARLHVAINDLPAAMLSVQRALRANPDYVDAHRLRATILGQLGEYDAAIQTLESLIARGMDWADLHYQVAELQRLRGRPADARAHLYSAIRLNPRFEQAKALLERCAA
jgi:tetratricopeptide (TPR) repeat protein